MQNIPKPQKLALNKKKKKVTTLYLTSYFRGLAVGYALKVSVVNRCDTAVYKGSVDFYFVFSGLS